MSSNAAISSFWRLLAGGVLLLAGCAHPPREIPERYRGNFTFDRGASIADWDAQTEWPPGTKDLLRKMAVPTKLTIEATRVVVTDVTSGQAQEQPARVRKVGPDFVELHLYSNFAKTNRVTTLRFDEGGFWLFEATLFPSYRERFRRSETPGPDAF